MRERINRKQCEKGCLSSLNVFENHLLWLIIKYSHYMFFSDSQVHSLLGSFEERTAVEGTA